MVTRSVLFTVFYSSRIFLTWVVYLSEFTSELVADEQEGKLFWLVNNCGDFNELIEQVQNLPLVKEEFLELIVLKLTSFSSLDCVFSKCFGR